MSKFIRYENLLSNRDIKDIKRFMSKNKSVPAGVYGDNMRGEINKTQRDTERWEVTPLDFPNITKKFEDLYKEDGLVVNQFDLLRYGEGQFFTTHQDSQGKEKFAGKNNMSGRVQSSSTMIDCTDDLEGGDLIIYGPLEPNPHNKRGIRVKLKKLQSVFFPSHFFHEVIPVVKGKRTVLVTWMGVPQEEIQARHERFQILQQGTQSGKIRVL